MRTTGPRTFVNKNRFIEKHNSIDNNKLAINFSKGLILISNDNNFEVTLTNAFGMTIKAFKGKGQFTFNISAKTFVSGVYFAVVSAKNGVVSRRCIAD